MEPFSYPNSQHTPPAAPAAAPASAPAPAAPAAASEQPTAEPKPFIYSNTNQPAPQGVPAEELPERVRELREQRKAESFFSAQNDYRDAGLEDAFASVQADEITDEVRAAAASEWKEIFADHNYSAAEAREAVSIARELAANPPDEVTEAKWQAEAWTALRAQYGDKGAQEALDLAKQLVARDPRVAAVLEHTRLGNHPKIIQQLVAKARSERGRGKL
jgi:hypothetical protein